MAERRYSRQFSIALVAALVIGGLTWAFWPKPVLVDLVEVTRGPLAVAVEEEARTRVSEAYVVSTLVDGRLLRVTLHPGDRVLANETPVARMRPVNPSLFDVRTREQARAAVAAAQAALEVAEADLKAAEANLDLAQSDLRRSRALAESGTVSEAALDRSESTAEAAEARRQTAVAAITQRRADLKTAQLQLIGFDDLSLVDSMEERTDDDIVIFAPTGGQILRVFHEDETTLPAGSPILEIGNIEQDLEVVADLVSSDAVRVTVGDVVVIRDWGGAEDLRGEVVRVEPFGETRVSALGIEEQRVVVVIALLSPPEDRPGLGHGYRVNASIVIWQSDDTLQVPVSALFRNGDDRFVFVEDAGVAARRQVSVGHDDGLFAEVLDGLIAGDLVIAYPPPDLKPGDKIVRRNTDTSG